MSNQTETKLPLIARLLLGLIFTVMGVNGFVHVIPLPSMPEPAIQFMAELAMTGYMIPLIKSVEIVSGLMLLSDRLVPLALVLLAPGIVNIALFHAFLAPIGLPMAFLVVALETYLAWCYRDVYRPMLTPHAKTTDSKHPSQRFAHHHS